MTNSKMTQFVDVVKNRYKTLAHVTQTETH